MNPAEQYILAQPEPFRSMLLDLQVLIETTIPSVVLLYKYKIPFYYINGKPFCYMNVTKGYVDVGFWHAAHLTVHTDKMVTQGRKIIKTLRFKEVSEIDDQVLIDVLQEAYAKKDSKFYK